jgi:hypothetical protein
MILGQEFKTVVFFGSRDPQYQYIREAFSLLSMIKVFRTDNVDELDQILRQSTKTAVLMNDLLSIDKLKNLDAGAIKKASIRFYFLDHQKRLTREEIDLLSYRRVSTLIAENGPELRKKLELYLLGKSNYFHIQTSSDNSIGSETETVSDQKSMFFTHFKHEVDGWNMVASTHEQELDIETVLNRSWTVYYTELIKRADSVTDIEQDPNFSDKFHAILFPHPHIKGLSLIHINKQEKNFHELMQKAFDFLQKI